MTKNLIETLFDDFNKFPVVGKTNPFSDMLTHTVDRYPPYNIIKTADGYLMEMAVPGYSKDELEVSFENRILKIKGNKRELEEGAGAEYVVKSLSTKAFTRTFTIGSDLEIESVFLENGLLCVDFAKAEPEKPILLTIQ